MVFRPIFALMLACGWSVSDEDRVKATISGIASAAAAPDLAGVLAPISDQYRDPEGITKNNLRGFLFRQFQTRGPVISVLSPISVEHETGSDRASASFEAVLAVGITLGDPMPDDADAYRFDVELEKHDGDWKVVSHTRTSATGSTFRITD
ncbi:MAG: hypothetical protein VX000_07120, partial [Myxococcota bacterium]|nr:hypothetical protein [Myxococcota bacterium]